MKLKTRKLKNEKPKTKKLRTKILFSAALLAIVALFAAACNHSSDSSSGDGDNSGNTNSTSNSLQKIKDRGQIVCGSRDALPGFANADSNGVIQGFDADFCRVIAAAIFGDSSKVEIKPIATADRFTALQSGEIDVLVRNTTWTATRDGKESADFLFTTFYDGQGIMVPDSSSVREIADLRNADICVASGTTTQLNLESVFSQRNIPYNPQSFADTTQLRAAYEAGQCEAWTSDVSQLTGFKNDIENNNGATQRILGEVISKEPLGPAVLDGNDELAQAVRWAVMSTVAAWEFGITSSNLSSMQNSDDPSIQRFLGKDSDGNDFNPSIGLPSDFAVQVIRQVGNYEEIYNRHITPLGIPLQGSNNDLWTNGGLLYTPPYR